MSTMNKHVEHFKEEKERNKGLVLSPKWNPVNVFKQWFGFSPGNLHEFDYNRILLWYNIPDQTILNMSLTQKRIESILLVYEIPPEETNRLSLEEKLAYIYLFIKD